MVLLFLVPLFLGVCFLGGFPLDKLLGIFLPFVAFDLLFPLARALFTILKLLLRNVICL